MWAILLHETKFVSDLVSPKDMHVWGWKSLAETILPRGVVYMQVWAFVVRWVMLYRA
jgi:hypothetical protein